MSKRLKGWLFFAVILAWLGAASPVHAFYNPSTGKWLSRDPVIDPGFRSTAIGEDREVDPHETVNLHAFLLNDSINKVDFVGLLQFEGCSPQLQALAQAAFTSTCRYVKRPEFRCCVGHFNIPQRLTYMCDHNSNITIKCKPAGIGLCSDACAYSFPGGSTINICGDALTSSKCIGPGCILLHEMTHMIGHGFEKWPVKVQNCLGCSRRF